MKKDEIKLEYCPNTGMRYRKGAILGELCPYCGETMEDHYNSIGPKPKGNGDWVGYEDMEKGGELQLNTNFLQLGILVLDGSESMTYEAKKEGISKGEAVNRSVREFFKRMQISTNKNSYRMAIVNFDVRAIRALNITEVTALNTNCDYNPTKGLCGQTRFYVGLQEAEAIAEEFLSKEDKGGPKRSVVIVIMTDGLDMAEKDTSEYLAKLKSKPYFDDNKIKITACYFEAKTSTKQELDYCKGYLGKFVKNPNECITVTSAEELRRFFEASVVIKC